MSLRSDVIEMVRENLYISVKEIRIDYVFASRSNNDALKLYQEKYCIDEPFLRALKRHQGQYV